MFVLSKQDNAMFRVIATLVSLALVLWGYGAHVHSAQAANLTNFQDLLETSATSTASNHTIQFVTPTGMVAGGTATVTFQVGFDLSSVTEDDIDFAVNGVDEDTAAAAAAAVWGVTIVGQDIIIESGTDTIAPNATVTIEIGSNATAFGTGDDLNRIVNPGTQGSYEIDIDFNGVDGGTTEVAIVDSVYVTAQVNTNFEFTVSGFATAGIAVNGTSTTGTTTATSLPFGLLANGEIETLAQELTVATNAIRGFVVTAEVDQQLLSSTGADIDAFDDGAFLNPKAWEAPGDGTPSISDENTWGHWGWTTEDTDTTRGAAAEFGANEWEGASTSPAVLFSHTSVADASTPGIGSTTVGFQIEITALQEAADDYSAILTYIATPTF